MVTQDGAKFFSSSFYIEQHYEVVIILASKMRKLRLREVQEFAYGHTLVS